ncbi:MAG: KEOPS complex subunit Cgi121 [Candidatus Bathyarchaeia archaeon]
MTSSGKIEFEGLVEKLKGVAPRSIVQVMDGDKILGYDHILFAVLNALNAREKGRTICEDPALEILVYASAQRQIRRAIHELGVRRDSRNLVLVAISDSVKELETLVREVAQIEGLRLNTSFLESWDKDKLEIIKKTFEISDSELESIRVKDNSERQAAEKIVIEKMALLSVSA